jgi:hypothetical protein
MIAKRNFALCLVATFGFVACGKKGMSDAGYLAAQKAIDAITRAYEYRDNGPLYYEPRLLDAQKAVSGIPVLKDEGPEFQFKMEAETCVTLLHTYRLAVETDEWALGKAGPDSGRTYYEVAKCVRDLPSVLGRLNSSEQ